MGCLRCNSENPEGANYCSSCGSPLELQCLKCGVLNRPRSRFCNGCGKLLSDHQAEQRSNLHAEIALGAAVDSGAAPEGERKLVTALFVDIVGSTILEQDLDPEDARAIIDPALKLMIDAARRYEGYVVQSTGDGIFALFGAPIAHEDHP